MFEYVRARTLKEALQFLADHGPEACVLAGGTDLLLEMRSGKLSPRYLVDISRLSELRGIRATEEGLSIGALTTVREVEISPLLVDGYRVLAQAAGTLGSVQVRNRATIGGNLCHAAPSADTAPALLALDAEAEIAALGGRERIPLGQFFLGPGQTVLGPDRLLVSLYLPRPAAGTAGVYIKHSLRRAMDLAFVGVAALLSVSDGHLQKVRIALGAVAPTPMRACRAEEVLLDRGDLGSAIIAEAARIAAEEARPIDDVRSTAWYRRRMVEVETRRALAQVAEALRGAQDVDITGGQP
jgi:carbon-monoxide dehydrogenase medium subunit